MHSGKSYKLSEFLFWTRRNLYWPLITSIAVAVLYETGDLKWLAIPWTVVALLGTATAFIVGFKNVQTYNRTGEATQVWGSIITSSRNWGIMVRDLCNDNGLSKDLVYRHFAWLTALRYQMRESRQWETAAKLQNAEYMKFYSIPEKEHSLQAELAAYISEKDLAYILTTQNKAAQLLSLQAGAVKELYDRQLIEHWKFLELQKGVKELFDLQGKSERIKNYPYPRQYASINKFFIALFCMMLPFGLLYEFDQLNAVATGFLKGNMVWLVIPFSVLISWVYTSLEQVGESTENPFEGSANDVPISQICRTIEIDLREMLGEKDLPAVLAVKNNIIL